MNLSRRQQSNLANAVALGLSAFYRPIPLTAVEWADEHYYLSAESSYTEQAWVTLPFQVAILNSMGNDEIEVVNFVKSARVGYSQMLKAAMAYMLEHKKRNQLLFQPTDGAASSFMKAHIDTMIRDVPCIKTLAPWYGKKHKDNTLDTKRFANKRQLWCVGGTAAKNYRERSVDTVIYDELAAFDPDVESEGSPTFLGDKRTEGSTFPKSIRGSTPKIKGQCQIERAAEESQTQFYFYLPCPHCEVSQKLQWGGPKADFGFKWVDNNPKTAQYLCKHCNALIENNQLDAMQSDERAQWICEVTNIRTKDGLRFYDINGKTVETPESVTWFIWSAYSPFSPWSRLVGDFLKTKGDQGKLKTFVNTSLGETWEEETGEKTTAESLLIRREVYQAQVPQNAYYITCGLDMQDTWIPGAVYAWGLDGERWLIDKFEVRGNPKEPQIWHDLQKAINREYTHQSGVKLKISRFGFDTGGHYADQVHAFARRIGITKMLPLKGASTYGNPICTMPKKPDRSRKTYLVTVGTDTAKESIFSSLKVQLDEPNKAQPGYFHLPMNNLVCDETWLNELCSESKRIKFVKGRPVHRWLPLYDGIRNEGLDCTVYAEVAFYASLQYFSLNMSQLAQSFKNIDSNKKPLAKKVNKRGTVTGGIK